MGGFKRRVENGGFVDGGDSKYLVQAYPYKPLLFLSL
tara:strand:- start:830 stop:940 length:111 start_codon:yes stop_codon:yes gene_type:complete